MENIDERKANLMKFSAIIKKMVDEGKYTTINEGLIKEYYKKNGHEIFQTFYNWKKQGFRIKKGVRAFILWSRPLADIKEENGQEPTEEDSKFFKVAYVFSNLQVEESGLNKAA